MISLHRNCGQSRRPCIVASPQLTHPTSKIERRSEENIHKYVPLLSKTKASLQRKTFECSSKSMVPDAVENSCGVKPHVLSELDRDFTPQEL